MRTGLPLRSLRIAQRLSNEIYETRNILQDETFQGFEWDVAGHEKRKKSKKSYIYQLNSKGIRIPLLRYARPHAIKKITLVSYRYSDLRNLYGTRKHLSSISVSFHGPSD